MLLYAVMLLSCVRVRQVSVQQHITLIGALAACLAGARWAAELFSTDRW